MPKNSVTGESSDIGGGLDGSLTAAAIATAGTITTAGVDVARISPAAAVTGLIMQAGSYPWQLVIVVNEAIAANTATMAAAGTSNVADGVTTVIPGLRSSTFRWNPFTSLWYRTA